MAAILLSAAAIFSVHVELHGTRDLELLVEDAPRGGAPMPVDASAQGVDEAIVSSRWATGFFSG